MNQDIHPDLFNNYLEFCNYRNEFRKSGILDLSFASFFYPTTLLPLLNLIMENPNLKIIESLDTNVASYINIIKSTDLIGSVNKSFIPFVQLPNNYNESDLVLQRIHQLVNSDVFGGENAFNYVVNELVNNIYEHSSFTKAMVMAQKYPIKGFVELCFFDNGITIPGSFAKHGILYDKNESYKAILDAINGLSSKGDKGRGFGLYSSVRFFLEGLGGQILLISGTGAVYISREYAYAYNLSEPYKLGGTLIGIRVQDSVKQIDISNYVE